MFWFRKKRIYLDYASATPPLTEALRAFRYASSLCGNPSSIHTEGVVAQTALSKARSNIARLLGVKAREVVFTSGATEANNLAILGCAKALEARGVNLAKTHWVVSAIEHPSVLQCFEDIKKRGGAVSYMEPDAHGVIHESEVRKALTKETVFVSVGWANHEIGVVQPLSRVARVIREHERKHESRIIFHSDAGQAPLYLSPQLNTLGVDCMTFDAGKLYAPRGIGMLVGKRNHRDGAPMFAPLILGGGQEFGIRAGTENVALASAFSVAFGIISAERESEARRLVVLRDTLAKEIATHIPNSVRNGDARHTLPHLFNISIPHIQSEYLVLQMDQAGIALATKSACKESAQYSHVVAALGGEEWRARTSLRFSLGMNTTARDIERVIEIFVRLL